MNRQIVTVTVNPAVDKSSEVPQVLPGPKLRCSMPRFEPGGGGINVAAAIHALGGNAHALWSSGGATGERMAALLDERGLRHTPVKVSGETRVNQIVRESGSDQQYRFGFPGPELDSEGAERWRHTVRRLEPAPHALVFSGSLPPGVDAEFLAQLVDAAPSGTRVVLDSSGPPLRAALAVGVFLVKPNLRELEHIHGEELSHEGDIKEAGQRIVDSGGAEVVVISIGKGGAFVVTREGFRHVRSPTVRVKNRVGAGDSMVAGLVFALSEGADAMAATRFGVAAGAAAVTEEGTGLCRRSDVDALLERMPPDES